MRRMTMLVALVAALVAPTRAEAQEIPESSTERELRAMVAEPTAAEADRQLIESFLETEAVEEVAADHGLDLERAKHGVRALDAEASSDLADRVRDLQEELVGGDTLIITSTTVIIILLILLIFAVD